MLPRGALTLLHGEADMPRLSHSFLPRLLLNNLPVLYLDGANQFDPLLLARLARQRNCKPSVFNQRLRVARAFTCFQLTELLERVPRLLRQFPACVVIVTALPDLYFDEDIREAEAQASFRRGLEALRRATQRRLTLAVFSGAGGFASPRRRFFHQLAAQANHVARFTLTGDGRPEFVYAQTRPCLKH